LNLVIAKTCSPQQVVQTPAHKIIGHTDCLTIFGQYFGRHYFAALDGKYFLSNDITQDLLALTDMNISNRGRMLNTLPSGHFWGFSRQNNRIARGFARA